MKRLFISLLLIITLICNFPCNVYASELGGGGYTHKWVDWTEEQRKAFCRDKLTGAILQRVGILLQPDKWTSEEWTNAWNKHLAEIEIASNMTYDEYIMSLVSVDEEKDEFIIPDALLDSFYSVANIYIEENSPFWVYETGSTSRMLQYYSTSFTKKSFYDSLGNYFKTAEPREYFYFSGFNPISYTYDDGTVGQCFKFYKLNLDNCSIVGHVGNYGYAKFFLYDSNWESLTYDCTLVTAYDNGEIIETDTTLSALEVYPLGECTYTRDYSTYNRYYYWIYAGAPTVFDEQYTPYAVNQRMFLSYDTVSFRVYNSLDDMKQYSLNQRPYYVTEKFVNYDSTVDNSTTITQTEIDNSITYGDVVTYIINNYDNPDGLTEEELIAILEKYLGNLDDDDDDGGGSGSGGSSDDDDDGGGSGLSGFLDGLGALGDALLAIIGKLLEYVGKAIELLSGTVTKVIDLVPSTITAILGTIFSFFPQEWMTAIELALVLGVVIGIVGIFKK